MHTIVAPLSLIVVLLLPSTVSAYTAYEEEKRQILMTAIVLLQKQIAMLESLLESQSESTVHSTVVSKRAEKRFADIDFYDGPYTAIYKVENDSDIQLGTGTAGKYDATIWDVFIDIAGADFAEDYVREFRTYNNDDSPHDAFVYRYGEDDWVFAVNTAIITPLRSSADYDMLYDLLVHEFAHMLFTEEYTSIEKAFADMFWNSNDYNHAKKIEKERDDDDRWDRLESYYNNNDDEFVSAYATTNYHEDAAETFTQFILNKRPNTNDEIEEKIDFMYDIDGFRELRADIRDDLNL